MPAWRIVPCLTKNYDVSEIEEENYFKGFWRMSFDGASSSLGSGIEIVFKYSYASIHTHAIGLEFPCINNEVEYEALIQGMILFLEMKIENLIIASDFE